MMLVTSGLPGCDFIESRKLAKKCRFALEGVEIGKFSFSGVTIGLTIAITNPNKKEVVMDRMDLYLYIEDVKTANLLLDGGTVPPGQTKRVDAAVSIPYSTIGISLPGLMKEGSVIRYRLAGTLYMKTSMGEMRFPVTVYKN